MFFLGQEKMDCPRPPPKKCHVDGKYFVVTCQEKEKRLLIYKSWKKGRGIKLLPPFDQLWFLPWELQSYAYMPTIDTSNERSFQLPSVSLSVLTGQTTPGNYTPLYWFAQALDGPITSQGVELNTIFSGIDYRVTWESDKPVRIGFYTQMAFLGSDIYPLVDNNYVLQLSCGTEGSFVMGNYERFYVAATTNNSEPANITLRVQVVMPECGEERTQRLRVKCCNYRVYKSKVDNFVVVNSFLNPQLKEVYKKMVETFLVNSLPAPQVTSDVLADNLQQARVRTYYNFVRETRTSSSQLPGLPSNPLIAAEFTSYTNTNEFTVPEYTPGEFPFRAGLVDDPRQGGINFLGVRISDLGFSIDIYYRITVNNFLIPQLKRLGAICVVAQFFDGVGNRPVNVVVGGNIVGNDDPWIENPQNPPAVSIITNSLLGNRRPLTIPSSFTNVVLCIRPGVKTAEQSFEMTVLNPVDAVNGFIVFESVIAVPTGTPPP